MCPSSFAVGWCCRWRLRSTRVAVSIVTSRPPIGNRVEACRKVNRHHKTPIPTPRPSTLPLASGTAIGGEKNDRSGIRTHAGKTRLRPERSALDRSAILPVRRWHIRVWFHNQTLEIPSEPNARDIHTHTRLGGSTPVRTGFELTSVGVLDSIVVSILACHVRDPGSIPGRGDLHFCVFLD